MLDVQEERPLLPTGLSAQDRRTVRHVSCISAAASCRFRCSATSRDRSRDGFGAGERCLYLNVIIALACRQWRFDTASAPASAPASDPASDPVRKPASPLAAAFLCCNAAMGAYYALFG